MFNPFAHNPDTNPNWKPNFGRRVYACTRCNTEQITTTNHTGTVPALQCKGPCRHILNPHTAREIVLPYHGPHHYIREARPMTTTNPHDVQQLVTCATNEGGLYLRWCAMARAGSNTTDGEWTAALRTYALELIRQRRYSGSRSTATIIAAAAELRDYYEQHIQESGQ